MAGKLVPVRLMAIGLVVAVVVIVLAYQGVRDQGAFWLEAGKAAMSVLAVGFFGVVISDFVKNRDQRREEERQLLEYRRKFLLDVGDAYGRVKAVRRILRAKGLGPKGPPTLTAAHLSAFDTQLQELSEAQLTFERLSRDVSQRAFTNRDVLERELGIVKKYLRKVITEWEDGSPHLRPGGSAEDLHTWPHLRALLLRVKDPDSDFKKVSNAVDAIEDAVWADVLPASLQPTEVPRRLASAKDRWME